jgi:hypothetical protein
VGIIFRFLHGNKGFWVKLFIVWPVSYLLLAFVWIKVFKLSIGPLFGFFLIVLLVVIFLVLWKKAPQKNDTP